MLKFSPPAEDSKTQKGTGQPVYSTQAFLKMPEGEKDGIPKPAILAQMKREVNGGATASTEIQRIILNRLWHFAGNSILGRWKGAGLASFILAAPDKLEKYNALMCFSNAIGTAYPNIIVAYANFEDHRFLKEYIIPDVEQQLRAVGIDILPRQWFEDGLTSIVRAMRSNDMHLILLLDNIEELYFCDQEKYPESRNIARGINALGSETSGRVATIVCGSSEKLPHLLYADRLYPGASFQYSFNESKFPAVYLGDINEEDNKKQCGYQI